MMDVPVLMEMHLMKAPEPLLVFTDLDGTLLDRENYSFAPAGEALDLLRRQGIPVVLCSSKTRAEIERLQQHLCLHHPFISENGGALFLPRDYFDFSLAQAGPLAAYEVIEFGAPYYLLVVVLHQIAAKLGVEVVGFSDMSDEEVARECRLSLEEARLAKQREYDEPFRIRDADLALRGQLFKALHRAGLCCTRGGCYHHLTGVGDKGLAIRTLKAFYERAWGRVVTVGLGDSWNDLSLLEEVDVPIVVRNPAAGVSARLLRKVPTARLTSSPGPRGWNEAILGVLERHAAD